MRHLGGSNETVSRCHQRRPNNVRSKETKTMSLSTRVSAAEALLRKEGARRLGRCGVCGWFLLEGECGEIARKALERS